MFKSSSIFWLLLSSFFIATTLSATDLDWSNDYNKTLVEAKKENKLVYLFIGADRCRFCEKFKKNTASKKEFADRMKKNFLLIYMSRDRDPVPEQFEKYGVPRHYFLTPEGKVIHTEQGVWSMQGWFSLVDEVISEKDDNHTQ